MLFVSSFMLAVNNLPLKKSLEVFNQIYQLVARFPKKSFPQLVSVTTPQHVFSW